MTQKKMILVYSIKRLENKTRFEGFYKYEPSKGFTTLYLTFVKVLINMFVY